MSHLVLSRKAGERVMLGHDIVVEVVEVRGRNVRLSFSAPSDVEVLREEIYEVMCPDLADTQ